MFKEKLVVVATLIVSLCSRMGFAKDELAKKNLPLNDSLKLLNKIDVTELSSEDRLRVSESRRFILSNYAHLLQDDEISRFIYDSNVRFHHEEKIIDRTWIDNLIDESNNFDKRTDQNGVGGFK